MSVSMYDQPAQAQFMQTYIPLPFDDIVQAGLSRQGRYDTNMAAQEQAISDLESIRAISGPDTEYVNKAVDTFRGIAEQYADKDYSNPEVIRDIARQVRRGGVDRRTLADIQSTYTNKREYDKLATQLGTPREWQEDLSLYSSQESGAFSGMPEKPLDTEGAFREAFANVGEESLGYTMDFGGGRKANMWGKSEKKLKQHISDNYERLAQDPRISQFIRRSGVDPNNHEEAKKLLLSEAPKYVEEKPYFYQEPKNQKDDYTFNAASNTQSLPNVNRLTSDVVKQETGINPEKVTNITDLHNVYNYDLNGNLKYKSKRPSVVGIGTLSRFNTAKEAGTTTAKDQFEFRQMELDAENIEQYNKETKRLDNIRFYQDQSNNTLELSDDKLQEAWLQAYSKAENIDYDKYLYETNEVNTSAKARITRQVIDDLGGRNLIIGETGKEAAKPVNTTEDLIDKLGLPKDTDVEKMRITGIVPGLGMYSASLKGKSFFISTNEREQMMLGSVSLASQLSLNGDIGDKSVSDNMQVRTILDKSPDGTYEYRSMIFTNDGSNFPGTKVSQMGMKEYESYSVMNLVNSLPYFSY